MKAKFITHPDFSDVKPIDVFHKELDEREYSHPDHLMNKHYVFRKRYTLAKKARAILKITADDYYKLYVNGSFVTQGPASSYPEHYYYNEIDLTDYLVEGDNTIAVHVYYQGLINRVWVSGDLRCMLWAELSLDGEPIMVSDESWLVAEHTAYSEMGRVGYDTAFLECYDARSELVGFHTPDFDDSNFIRARVHTNADYTLAPQPTEQLIMYKLEPKSIEQKDGMIRVDFGREAVGYPIVRAKGKSGEVITVRLGEELCEDCLKEMFIRKD